MYEVVVVVAAELVLLLLEIIYLFNYFTCA